MTNSIRNRITGTFAAGLVALVLAASIMPALGTGNTGANPPDPFDPVRAEQQRREAISAQQPVAVDFDTPEPQVTLRRP